VRDTRRSLVSRIAFATFAHALYHPALGLAVGKKHINLVPKGPSLNPNYWCTWAAQNYMYGQGQPALDPQLLEGTPGAKLAEEQLREATLFGSKGWLENFHTKVRSDLYVLMDEGWEEGGYATFIPDGSKFPSLHGTPPEKLKQLNEAVQAHGWRALALWCRDTPGGEADRKLVRWSRQAGIRYWKIDGGDKTFHVDQIRNQEHSPLVTEHVYPEGPLNGDWRNDGRFGPQIWGSPRLEMMRQADVYRTYDTSTTLSIPTTIDRIAEMLKASQGHAQVRALLNCEDEVYLAAALGCTICAFDRYTRKPRSEECVQAHRCTLLHLRCCSRDIPETSSWVRSTSRDARTRSTYAKTHYRTITFPTIPRLSCSAHL